MFVDVFDRPTGAFDVLLFVPLFVVWLLIGSALGEDEMSGLLGLKKE